MKNKFIAIAVMLLLSVTIIGTVYAATPIKLVIGGQEITTDVLPQIVNNRVLVPIRVISENLGAKVEWNEKTRTVTVEPKENTDKLDAKLEARIAGLERALAPKDAKTAAELWAEGVKTRNGALQYAVLSPELKKEMYDELSEWYWTTGTSSPWGKSFEVIEKAKMNDQRYRYEIAFTWTDSTQSIYLQNEYIVVEKFEENWFVSSIERIDVKGKITKIDLDEAGKVKSIFVEDESPEFGSYDKATLVIDEDTKIYKGYADEEISAADLKEGDMVEAIFNGPVIMMYPVQGGAKMIRVIE